MEVVHGLRAAYVVGVGAAHDVGVVGTDRRPALRVATAGDDQRHVPVLDGGEVGHQRVEGVGPLDQHQAPRGTPAPGPCCNAVGELAVGQVGVAGDHCGGVGEPRVVEDRTRRRVERGQGHGVPPGEG